MVIILCALSILLCTVYTVHVRVPSYLARIDELWCIKNVSKYQLSELHIAIMH